MFKVTISAVARLRSEAADSGPIRRSRRPELTGWNCRDRDRSSGHIKELDGIAVLSTCDLMAFHDRADVARAKPFLRQVNE